MKLTVTECEKLIAINRRTNNWYSSPSDYRFPAPKVPAGFECYAKNPDKVGEQYWYVRKA